MEDEKEETEEISTITIDDVVYPVADPVFDLFHNLKEANEKMLQVLNQQKLDAAMAAAIHLDAVTHLVPAIGSGIIRWVRPGQAGLTATGETFTGKVVWMDGEKAIVLCNDGIRRVINF